VFRFVPGLLLVLAPAASHSSHSLATGCVLLPPGSVELLNLDLKPEALDFLGLPIELIRGSIGRVQVRIKWRQPGMKPSIVIDDVFALARFKYEWTREEQEHRWNLAIQGAEASAKAFLQARLKAESPPGMLESLGASIVDNLQIQIRGIHIRFEDHDSNPLSPFSFGVTLESLTASVRAVWCCHTLRCVALPTAATQTRVVLPWLCLFCFPARAVNSRRMKHGAPLARARKSLKMMRRLLFSSASS